MEKNKLSIHWKDRSRKKIIFCSAKKETKKKIYIKTPNNHLNPVMCLGTLLSNQKQ